MGWPALVTDMAAMGVRLYTRPVMLWAEFRTLIGGLLSSDSRLWHALKPPSKEEEPPMPGG